MTPAITKAFTPKDPHFDARVRASFERQRAMTMLGIRIYRLSAGSIELDMPFSPEFTQQHGFVHAGIISTALDSACGYAAFSLMPPEFAVLTVEFKTNLLAPASAERFRFQAQVVKPGRTVTVCEAWAFALQPASEKLVATMSATLMAVQERGAISQ